MKKRNAPVSYDRGFVFYSIKVSILTDRLIKRDLFKTKQEAKATIRNIKNT